MLSLFCGLEEFLKVIELVVIIASAVILVWQMHETRKAVKANTYQEIISGDAELGRLFLGDTDLHELSAQVPGLGPGETSLTYKESWMILMLLSFFENLFVQKDMGTLDDKALEYWKRQLDAYLKSDKVRLRWSYINKDAFYPSFREYVEGKARALAKLAGNSGA